MLMNFYTFFIAAFMGAILYGVCVQCVKQNRAARAQQEAASEERRRNAARAVVTRAASEAQQATGNIDAMVDGMTPSDRMAYVKNFLKTEIMTMARVKEMMATEETMEEQAVEGSVISSSKQGEGSMLSSIREASGFWSVGGDDGTSQRLPHCAICLERLKVNEEIGLSQNDECPHVFHKSCVTEWLLTNKGCPICRRKYLDIESV